MHRSVLHSKSFQRYFLTYAAIFAAMIFISILLLARTTNNERARAAEQQRALQTEKISTQLDDMWKSAGSVGELLNNSSWVKNTSPTPTCSMPILTLSAGRKSPRRCKTSA